MVTVPVHSDLRVMLARALAEADGSHNEIRAAIQRALDAERMTLGPDAPYCFIADIYEDYFVQGEHGSFYRRDYTMNDDGTAILGEDRTEVIPRTEYDEVEEAQTQERKISSEEREKAKASDFAGKNRSFPILRPADVTAAASSLGRAGADNYSTEQIKKNIIKICKRKGAAFMAKLPKKWREDMGMEEAEETALTGDFVPLLEGLGQTGTALVKLIQPGWGDSGFYPPSVLARDGPKVFKAGTKMFWNHPTEAERRERPEGDLRNLAAELVEDAQWRDGEQAGLYSRAKVFKAFLPAVRELAPHIGVSINAMGRARQGEADGKSGRIIEAIAKASSVDFVTKPGAGGEILQIFEAARSAPVEDIMTEEQQKLQEAQKTAADAQAENGRLRELLNLREARDFVTAKVPPTLPGVTRNPLIASLASEPVIKDGKLDTEAMEKRITEAVRVTTEEISEILGTGKVRGMGNSASEPTVNLPEVNARLEKSFRNIGLSESAAKTAAQGRVN